MCNVVVHGWLQLLISYPVLNPAIGFQDKLN